LKAETLTFITLLTTISLSSSLFLVYAQDFQYVLGTDFYAFTDRVMPQKNVPFTDPNFHTTLIRITDKTDGYTGTGIQNEYSKSDPENIDGTLVILRGNNGEWYLYETSTFQMIKQFGGWFVDGIEPEPRWHATNPKMLYYIYETQLRTYSVDADASEVVHDFKTDYPSASYITTGSEGNPSFNQRYWGFLVKDSDYNLISAVVYDMQTDSVVGGREVFPDTVEDVSMDMSGKHAMLGFDSHVFQVCSRDFSSFSDLPMGANGHNDFALTADGKDALVYQNTQTDYICMTDLETLIETPLTQIPFTVNPDIGLHISGNCAEKPGWVLVSTYGAKQAPPDQSHSWMDTQLFMLQLQKNPTVWRIAHTHAYTSDESSGDKNYFAEAFATINRAGSRVYFGSNWSDFTADYSDTYQVILPSGWATIAPDSAPTPTPTPSPQPTGEEINSTPPAFYAIAILGVATVIAITIVILKRQNK
jgi:hypothetical protein